jgi:hypothetical protein
VKRSDIGHWLCAACNAFDSSRPTPPDVNDTSPCCWTCGRPPPFSLPALVVSVVVPPVVPLAACANAPPATPSVSAAAIAAVRILR